MFGGFKGGARSGTDPAPGDGGQLPMLDPPDSLLQRNGEDGKKRHDCCRREEETEETFQRHFFQFLPHFSWFLDGCYRVSSDTNQPNQPECVQFQQKRQTKQHQKQIQTEQQRKHHQSKHHPNNKHQHPSCGSGPQRSYSCDLTVRKPRL